MARTIDVDKLIARIMRLSRGDMKAQWSALGIVKVVEEEAAETICGKNADDFPEKGVYNVN